MASFQQGSIHIREKSIITANADVGWLRLYANTDGNIHIINENGVDYRCVGNTELASISGSLQNQINILTPLTTTSSISSNLQNQINLMTPLSTTAALTGQLALSSSLKNNSTVTYIVQSGVFSDPGGSDGDIVYVV